MLEFSLRGPPCHVPSDSSPTLQGRARSRCGARRCKRRAVPANLPSRTPTTTTTGPALSRLIRRCPAITGAPEPKAVGECLPRASAIAPPVAAPTPPEDDDSPRGRGDSTSRGMLARPIDRPLMACRPVVIPGAPALAQCYLGRAVRYASPATPSQPCFAPPSIGRT